MKDIIKPECMKMYIHYRRLSVFCSTAAYLIWLPQGKGTWYSAVLVPFGMILACTVGEYLYQKMMLEEKSRAWFLVTILLEQFAYGIFIYMSGGLSSPYLWCFLGYLFLIAVINRYRILLLLSAGWMVGCILLGDSILGLSRGSNQLYINTVIGIIIVSAGFYTLQKYSIQLVEKRMETEALNESLVREKAVTEQALRQIKDLYDTIKIFAVVDQSQSMDELTEVLARSVAPYGCMLLKFEVGAQSVIEDISSFGLQEEAVRELLKEIKEIDMKCIPKTMKAGGNTFVVKAVGEGIFVSGLLLLALRGNQRGLIYRQMVPFYQGIIETVFRDMDMQKKLEEGIIKEEQHRIASEIHDTVIQKLFGISCSLKALENDIPELSSDEIRRHLTEIGSSTRLAMKELREAIYGIRFESESGESFGDKLILYIEEMQRLGAVPISLAMEGNYSFLSVVQKTVLYRILCEAVSNALRHGQPNCIKTRVRIDEKGIYLWIQDDGAGFECPSMPTEGMGMGNMHRLAALMKGHCTVQSNKGKGTTVEVFMP